MKQRFCHPLLSSENGSLELVSTAEIYGAELSGAIVSLSACQTASGLTGDPGQHLSGFPTAFADAGAKLIIASLWDVADTTSKRFSEAFFLSLKNSRSFLKASQAAREAVSPRICSLYFNLPIKIFSKSEIFDSACPFTSRETTKFS